MENSPPKRNYADFEYSGELYFPGFSDRIEIDTFQFSSDGEHLQLSFKCEESESGAYCGKPGAKLMRPIQSPKQNVSSLNFILEPIRPYREERYQSIWVYIRLILKVLRDDEGRIWLYVDGTWTEDGSESKMIGLLEGTEISRPPTANAG